MSEKLVQMIFPGIEIVDLGLYLTDEKILVISDLHIGIEESLVKQGVLVPKFHFKDLVDRVERIFRILKETGRDIEVVVVNGDLKHEFGTISDEEWRNTLKMLDLLGRRCKRVVLVQGNHDKVLGPIAEKRKVVFVKSFIDGDKMIVHGDKEVLVPSGVKTLIIGHDHPAVGITDELKKETYKCFLRGKWKGKNLIVMPSMNPLMEGSDMLVEKPLSPMLSGLARCEVFVVADKVYEFGKVSRLRKGL